MKLPGDIAALEQWKLLYGEPEHQTIGGNIAVDYVKSPSINQSTSPHKANRPAISRER